MKRQVAAADAVLLVTLEYYRAVPGPLGNALDWDSRPRGQRYLARKPAACCGASPEATGTTAAQIHLETHMETLGRVQMCHSALYLSFKTDQFAADGTVTHDRTRGFLRGFYNAFAAQFALQS